MEETFGEAFALGALELAAALLLAPAAFPASFSFASRIFSRISSILLALMPEVALALAAAGLAEVGLEPEDGFLSGFESLVSYCYDLAELVDFRVAGTSLLLPPLLVGLATLPAAGVPEPDRCSVPVAAPIAF